MVTAFRIFDGIIDAPRILSPTFQETIASLLSYKEIISSNIYEKKNQYISVFLELDRYFWNTLYFML